MAAQEHLQLRTAFCPEPSGGDNPWRARPLMRKTTSLLTYEKCEIRAPIVVRLLIFSPKARGYAYKTGYGDHARGVGVRSSFPVPEIVRKNREFARIAHKRPSAHPPNRSTARWVPFGLRSVWTEDAYPNDKSAVFMASSGQNSLAAAAPRISHAVHGEGGRRDGLPRELPCAGTARIGSL